MIYLFAKWRSKIFNLEFENAKKKVKKKIIQIIVGKNTLGKMFRCYLLCILIGAIFLFLPISLQHPGCKSVNDPLSPNPNKLQSYSFFDALFISVTAFTDTGVVNLNVDSTYNVFGKVVIMILIQLGGLGFVSIVIFFWKSFKSKRSSDLDVNVTLFNERGGGKIGNTYRTILVSIISIVIVEFIFAIIYSFWFYYIKAYNVSQLSTPRGAFYYNGANDKPTSAYHSAGTAIFWGIFHSISAINNAGIDIIGANSLAPYRNDANIFLQVCFIIQIIFGGIGYPIIYDFFEHIHHRIKKRYHQLNLFFKIGLIGYFSITLVGGAFLFGMEFGLKNSFVNYLSEHPDVMKLKDTTVDIHQVFGRNITLNKVFAILFELFSTRSAGYSTFNNSLMTQPSQWIVVILMLIGANPSSTGGGIRSTTLIIIILTIFSRFKKNAQVNIFHRKISEQTIVTSYVTTLAMIFLVVLFAIIGFACYHGSNNSVFDCLFVCVSSFGTVGLSTMNFVSSSPGEIIFLFLLIILMIIGQLGASTILFNSTKLNEGKNLPISYPVEDVKTG